METNSAQTLWAFGNNMASGLIETSAQGLEGFADAAVSNGYQDSMLSALASILVGFAIVWGIWYIAKKLYRGAKSVK